MNKRIEKKIEKRDQLAHEQALSETSWGRIQVSLEKVLASLRELVGTLRAETGVWEHEARVELQKSAKVVDDSVSSSLSRLPVVGETAARNLHAFATDPRFASERDSHG